jgi:hypothetical protein
MTEYRRKHRRRRTDPIRRGVLILLVIVAGWLAVGLYRVGRTAAAVRADVTSAVAVVEGGIQNADPREVASLLDTTHEDLRALQSAARPLLWIAPHMGWVPRYGPTIQAAPVLLDIGVDLTAAGNAAIDPLMPLFENAGEDTRSSPSFVSEATATLTRARPSFQEALAAILEAQSARETLDAEALAPRLHPWMARLDRYLPLVEQVVRAALLAPDLLGAEEPCTYLLLVQNEDELRPTGGFISGVSRVRLADGQIEITPFQDSYAIDDFSQPYPEPPEPLKAFMAADLWVFRDSNWSPDFPTSARKAIELYSISRDVEIDGVIALDQQAISLLLGPLGPLQVEGADQTVTGQNVLRVAREAWARGQAGGSDWWRHRKDIMGSVLDAAMEQLQMGMDRQQMVGLTYAALEALREKHALIYLEDPAAANVLGDLGWDGALADRPGDYLMVVNFNMGFNKVNAAVEESLDYAVDLTDPTGPRAMLTVRHRHPVAGWRGPCSQEPRYGATYEDMVRRCYYDYVRVYVPTGAELLHGTPHPVPGSILLSGERQRGQVDAYRGEEGKTVFATFLVLRPGESLETTFDYALPEAILERGEDNGWRYRLTLQKQPGTDARPATVRLRIPAGAEVITADPRPGERHQGLLVYSVELRTDLRLDLTWRGVDRD